MIKKTRKLETVQQKENLNKVLAIDEKGNGGANHTYEVRIPIGISKFKSEIIQFQDGPRNVEGSTPGVTNEDLLEIVRDRLECFQEGDFPSPYTKRALDHTIMALECLNARIEDRIERKVLGKNER